MMLLLGVLGCAPTDWRSLDAESWDAWAQQPITLRGRVRSEGPLEGVTVSWADGSVLTEADGTFAVELPRANVSLTFTANGFHPAVRAAWLARPVEVGEVEVDVRLEPRVDGVPRLLFGGDVMFGRRFVDVDGETPRDTPYPQRDEALVQADDPASGARDALSRIAPLLKSADYTSINLETPILTDPTTPHPEKPFVFYSDPRTLEPLSELGVDFVGLGNNHVYDYLEDGLQQTLDALSTTTLDHAGAGFDIEGAWAPTLVDVNGRSLSYFAANSIDGWRWDPSVDYVASDTKGGAADLQAVDQIEDALSLPEAASTTRVVQVHTGVEYAHGPTDTVRRHVDNVLTSGADLVIGHHPHTPQGFSEIDGTFVAWSLGNLAFDGLRLETLLGILVDVDLGDRWTSARVHPVYLEDFRPRPAAGALADRTFRYLTEFSEDLVVVGEAGVGRIVPSSSVSYVRRELVVDATPDANGVAIVDLRELADADEFVDRIQVDAPGVDLQLGRDLLGFGEFEDLDVDEDQFELARWDHTGDSVFPCRTRRTGVGGLCSVRTHLDLGPSLIPFRQRVRVFGDAEGTPEKNLTLLGWSHGRDAGDTDLRVDIHASFGETIFASTVVGTLPAGTHDWQRFAIDVQVPDDLTVDNNPEINPRAVRLFIEHHPPRVRGAGIRAFDDLAIVGWSDALHQPPLTLGRPHANDFLRVSGLDGPTSLSLTVARPTLP